VQSRTRSISWVALLLFLLWLLIAGLAARGAPETLLPPLPPPLRAVHVPEPAQLDQFVADRAAAIRLGKALFWDMQVGSDGVQACGSCHFQAGADPRLKNQLNPDLNGNDPTFTSSGGPNGTLTARDFPFHRLANPGDPNSVVGDRNDVAGSQGVFKSLFIDVIPGSAVDQVMPAPDAVFNVRGVNTRRVESRNAPTVINSIFNHRNFWDGRAQSEFNGVDPFGSRNASARVLKVDLATGMPVPVETGITEGASLASLAVGPAVNPNEMSAEGRTLPRLGKKMLSLRPLAKQFVAADDSVLGALSSTPQGRTGLNTTYAAMIRAAFRPEWWRSPAIVTTDANGTPVFRLTSVSARRAGRSRGRDNDNRNQGGGNNGRGNGNNGQPGSAGNGDRQPATLTTSEYTVTEANFSLFFGLSVQLYLATLVSDDTPFDRFLAGDTAALTAQRQAGLQLFFNKEKAGCVNCHVGSELTEASYSECYQERIDELNNLNGVEAKYDKGFVSTGVRSSGNDIGIGGTDPFGNPLADSRRLQLGQLPRVRTTWMSGRRSRSPWTAPSRSRASGMWSSPGRTSTTAVWPPWSRWWSSTTGAATSRSRSATTSGTSCIRCT
jgi:cytochrome c peroxidase